MKLFLLYLFAAIISAQSVSAQESRVNQSTFSDQEKAATQPTPTALAAYTNWRDKTLANYAQGVNTPHQAVAVITQRLDDSTAQFEFLLAADMKQYTVTVRPVSLTRQDNGSYLASPVGKVMTLKQKAGKKLTQGPDKIRVGDSTAIIPVTKATQALEVTWAPKNDKDEASNKTIVRLSKEPAIMVD